MGKLIFRNANGLVNITQGIFRHQLVSILAKQNPDSGLVSLFAELFIYCLDIEVKFASMFRFKVCGFQFNDYITVKPGMLEKEVNKKVPLTNLQGNLSADIGESRSQFQQEMGDMFHKSFF